MKKLIFAAILAAAACGCRSPKSRSLDASGMYVSETGRLAIGKIHVDAVPEGEDTAVVHYKEDTALLAPSVKTHAIDVILTGSNSVIFATSIIESICSAFVAVAPKVAEVNAGAPKGVTTLDVVKANVEKAAEVRKAIIAADAEIRKEQARSGAAAASASDAECPDGKCQDAEAGCAECEVGG